MKKKKQIQVFANRAKVDISKAASKDVTDFECCEEELIFAMRDNYHEFSIGLCSILECLAVAEKEGYVPELPEDWWFKIRD